MFIDKVDIFWSFSIYFQYLSINFKLFDQIWIQINQIRHNDKDSDDEFGSQKSIKRWFKSNIRWILGLSWFNGLSLQWSDR